MRAEEVMAARAEEAMAVRAEEAIALREEEAKAARTEEVRTGEVLAEEAMAGRAEEARAVMAYQTAMRTEEACQRGSVSGSIGDTTAVQGVKAMEQARVLLYGSSTWERPGDGITVIQCQIMS
jgi:hypothetical protein